MLYTDNECDTQPDDAQKELAESNKIEIISIWILIWYLNKPRPPY